jgi:hypothetical protein
MKSTTFTYNHHMLEGHHSCPYNMKRRGILKIGGFYPTQKRTEFWGQIAILHHLERQVSPESPSQDLKQKTCWSHKLKWQFGKIAGGLVLNYMRMRDSW